MRKAMLLCAVLGCGGGAAHSVNPAGTWSVTDTLKQGACGAAAPETLTVTGSSGSFALEGYTMTSTYCASDYCELQGAKSGASRDVVFYADGSAAGNLTEGSCFYASTGSRK